MTQAASHRLAVVAWAIVGGAVCGAMIPLEPNLLEEGIVLHLAQRMAGGEHLFSDLASFTGPLPFELLALLFRVFGEELLVGRAAVALMHGLACSAVFALASGARSGRFSHLAAAFTASAPVLLFPLLSLFFYAVTLFHLAIYASWAAWRGVASPRHALLAGALVALAALCKQNVGAALAVTLGLSLVACSAPARRVAHGVRFAAGGLAVAAATLALYALRGDVGALYESLVTLPLSFSSSFNAPYMNLWPLGEFREDIFLDRARYVPSLYGFRYSVFEGVNFTATLWTQLLYAAPFFALALTGLARWRGGPLPPAVWVHAATLAALTTNLFPRTDWGHLVYVLPSTFAQLALLARPIRASSLAAVALVGGLGVATASAGFWLHDRAAAASYGPRLPLRAVSSMLQGEPLSKVIEVLRRRTTPGEPIFVARSEPLLYFATDTSNPTPYSGVIPGIRDEQQRRIVNQLQRVRFAVMSDIDQPAFLYYSEELPAVQAFFERYFRVSPHVPPGWLTLLVRTRDRGPVAVDFVERRESGRYFERRYPGDLQPASAPPLHLASAQNRRILPFSNGRGGGGIDFDSDVPKEAILHLSVGLWRTFGLRRAWDHPRDVRIRVSASRDGEGFELLLEQAVLSKLNRGHRWRTLRASLEQYAGERITLRFELVPHGELEEHEVAWLGSPRIVLAAGSDAAIRADRATREARAYPDPPSSSTTESQR